MESKVLMLMLESALLLQERKNLEGVIKAGEIREKMQSLRIKISNEEAVKDVK